MEKKEQQRKTEIEIDIIPLLKALLTKLWIMLLVGIVFAGMAYGSTKILIKPTYRSGFTAYVNNRQAQLNKEGLSSSDLYASQQLTKTFSYIIRSNSVLSAALKSIDSDLTYSQLSGMVSTRTQDDTELISVYVVNRDPQVAFDLANAIAKTAPTYMADIVEGSSMKIVDYPVFTNARYGPSYFRYGILGFAAGFILVLVIVLIKYFKDDCIKSENELEERFSFSVLGVIPDINLITHSGSGYYGKEYGSRVYKRQSESESK